ncbi:prephenate dehydrogenase [Salinarchaeum sp. Harcht-Bsk1]|uniref:NAD(P)-binding domain-containing protein n=1 Tax=Salinarchaeum sp. Harcht-Bsk1 TaxID=1333523 RepID=UPI0003423F10|nr:NAD(P)-binding domain-containing protein [Salinarchaeum sp. Harcht-Bsk1]AGN02449.1 prephenate dehydrogenase [Salinarchaeum sp. Harcht-Bsk1]
MELLVVGAGTMGRWFARTVDAEVAFADRDPEAAAEAAAAVGGSTAALDGAESFDVVAIAVPMSAAEDAIAGQAGRARHAVLDVTGEMGTALDAMATQAPELERASLHPLFAPENAPGSVAVVVDAAGPEIDAVLADLEAAGNELFATTPEEHDTAMESVQAAAHAAIVAYGLARESVPDGFATPVSAALDDVLEQVTKGDPGVYAEIQDRFDGADAVAEAAAAVADADPAELRELVVEARPELAADGDGSEENASARADDQSAAPEDDA